jgi:multiple sugar transport system substrate-binding protein
VAEVPKTWDEQYAAAELLTVREGGELVQAGYPPLPGSVPGKHHWFAQLLYTAGGDELTEDGRRAAFNTEAGLLTMQFSQEILDLVYPDHNFQLPEAGTPDFVSGRVPVGFGALPVRSIMEVAPELIDDIWFGGALKGRGAAAEPSVWTGTGGKYIWNATEHPDQTWKLLEFFNTPEIAAQWLEPFGLPPASSAVVEVGMWSEDPLWIDIINEYDQYGKALASLPEPGKLFTALGGEVERVMFHEATPQEGLDAAEAAYNEILSEYWAE